MINNIMSFIIRLLYCRSGKHIYGYMGFGFETLEHYKFFCLGCHHIMGVFVETKYVAKYDDTGMYGSGK